MIGDDTMNIIEMIGNYESLKEEYDYAEKRAMEYESRYDEMTNIGYSEEDSYTHAMACTWSSYEDEMSKTEKAMQQCNISNDKIVAKQLIKEFQAIEINTLMNELHDWFNCYGDNTEVFTQPLFFMHSEEGSFYDDMLNSNYIDDFEWNIKKEEYFITKTKGYGKTPTIKSYNQKEFFNWLEKELSIYIWWDDGVTEELEAIIQIIHPNYYHW